MLVKKNLLIIAHYYYPDVASTGQILKDIAEGVNDTFNVSIICAVPSYTGQVDDKHKKRSIFVEYINGIKIYRVRVSEFNKNNKPTRIRNILDYFIEVRKLVGHLRDIDYVLALSQPPILGGMIGTYAKHKLKCKLIYNIQDFNPEQMMAVNFSNNQLLMKLLMFLDKRTCRKSDLIITVGKDLVETVNKRFNYKNVPRTVMINNWIDEKEIYPLAKDDKNVLAFKQKYHLDNKFIIMYSGNIGLYYDLEKLIEVVGRFKQGTKTKGGQEVMFAFVGAGSVLDKLVLYAKQNHLDNVVFIPYQNKADLIYSLNAGDVHWCVNAKGIKGVSCPSKVYGIMAASKPILGVLESGSEVRCLIENTNSGLCCEPGEYDKVEENIRWFIDNAKSNELKEMGARGRKYLDKNLTKNVSVGKYKEEIMKL